MRRILCLVISLISLLLSSCGTTDYVYIHDEPVELPFLEEVIDGELLGEVRKPLDLVRDPGTTGDIIHNMAEYQRGYFLMERYSDALEDYIDTIIQIHNGGIKDGMKDDIHR